MQEKMAAPIDLELKKVTECFCVLFCHFSCEINV